MRDTFQCINLWNDNTLLPLKEDSLSYDLSQCVRYLEVPLYTMHIILTLYLSSGTFDVFVSRGDKEPKLVSIWCLFVNTSPTLCMCLSVRNMWVECNVPHWLCFQVFNYDNEGSFGELALMYNTPR